MTMQRFQQEGVRTYDQASRKLKSLKIAPSFDTPKHHVTIVDVSASEADCTIIVLSADTVAHGIAAQSLFAAAKQPIILINKMDGIEWSEEQFQKIVQELGYNPENVPIIPISALKGDNITDRLPSPKSPWYKGWKKNGQSGTSLLEALDVALGS
ncbi:translation elongation factor EF-1 alpha [Pseudogymnoascus destructans]|nr:translation elongation factor EF-1 alpha [Pseudogymnoascus destructans]OAF56660.1 translation elongation factor EF-1 alpha [Pseudogymnoascus destructans]